METETTHTATPWPKATKSGDGKRLVIEVEGDGWQRLYVEVNRDDCDTAQAEADAEFIVHAVNLHDELLLSLRDVLTAYQWEANQGDGIAEQFAGIVETAKAVIQKARA